MLTKSEAKQLVHRMTVESLRRNTAAKLFKNPSFRDNDFKKLNKEMEALADFLEKRGKINESSETDVSGESGPEEAEVSSVRQPKA